MTGAVGVRRAQTCDAADIAAAERLYIDCPWTEKQIADEIESSSALFYVAETDGRFVGYISGAIAADECELSNIAVVEEYRRRGAALALFDALLDGLRELRIKTVFLLVRKDNVAAVALYEKIGFAEVGQRPRYYKGKDALIMRLNL